MSGNPLSVSTPVLLNSDGQWTDNSFEEPQTKIIFGVSGYINLGNPDDNSGMEYSIMGTNWDTSIFDVTLNNEIQGSTRLIIDWTGSNPSTEPQGQYIDVNLSASKSGENCETPFTCLLYTSPSPRD